MCSACLIAGATLIASGFVAGVGLLGAAGMAAIWAVSAID